MASHVTNIATKYEDPKPIRSWVTSYNGSHWLALEMRTRPLRMRESRDAWVGVKNNYIFSMLGIPDPDLTIHYAPSVALRWM